MTTTLERNGCDECGSPQLARNTWFTGKLLTERDLTDEQRYLLGKLSRHNQYLHGSGIVCGLEVGEHPNPACRTDLVIVAPGLAIDCCGHEILLTHEEVVPLADLIQQAWAQEHRTDPLTGPHRVQLCVAYRECLTEDVEALLEPCDDTGCRPNRILDSYAFGVKLDVPAPAPLQPAALTWQSTVAVAGANRFALDAGGDRLYVLTGSTLMTFAASTGAVLGALTLPAAGLDVAVSRTGDRVYVAVAAKDAVLVLDPSAPGTPVATLSLAAAPTGAVRLAAPGTGGILALDVAGTSLHGWPATVDSGTVSAPATATVGTDRARRRRPRRLLRCRRDLWRRLRPPGEGRGRHGHRRHPGRRHRRAGRRRRRGGAAGARRRSRRHRPAVHRRRGRSNDHGDRFCRFPGRHPGGSRRQRRRLLGSRRRCRRHRPGHRARAGRCRAELLATDGRRRCPCRGRCAHHRRPRRGPRPRPRRLRRIDRAAGDRGDRRPRRRGERLCAHPGGLPDLRGLLRRLPRPRHDRELEPRRRVHRNNPDHRRPRPPAQRHPAGRDGPLPPGATQRW